MTDHQTRTSLRPAHAPLRMWFGAACAAFLLIALFTLPYHIPVPPSFSDSYVFAYNNRAGLILVVLFGVVAAVFLPSPPMVTRPIGKPLTRSTLVKALAVVLLLGIPLVLLTYRLDGFLESVYSVDRTRLLLEGHIPYRDFEFSYGLLSLYGPAFLVVALHLSVPAACEIFFLAACLLGVWQLYIILVWSEFPPHLQRHVFLTVLILFLPAMMATSTAYTLPRFLTAGLFAMLSQRLLARATRRDHLLALLLPIPAVALNILLSPEMGVAYAAGIALYLLRFGRLNRPPALAAYAFMLAGTAAVLLLAKHLGAFLTLTAFGTGGLNFPIVPAPHLLLFLIAIAIAAAYCTANLRTGQNTPTLALACIALPMLPAALGRCDPGHVLFDGIPILILALLVCSSTRLPRLLPGALMLAFVFLPLIRGIRGLVSTLTLLSLPYLIQARALDSLTPRDAWVERLTLRIWGPHKGPVNFDRMRNRQTNDQTIDLPATFSLPPGTVFAAPFAFFGSHTGPYHTAAVDEGYFLSVINMVTPGEVDRKIAELDRHPERPILLPAGAERSCSVEPGAARAEIVSLFAYPYRAPAVHPGDVMEPLCAFIRAHYRIAQPASAAHFGDALWQRDPHSDSIGATSQPNRVPSQLIR